MTEIADVISLQLHAFGLSHLHDRNWTGLYLYDHLKRHVRGRAEPKDLLRKPLERGLPYYLGGWLFDDFFSPDRICELQPESRYWFLSDFVDLISFHEFNVPSHILAGANKLLCDINMRFVNDEVDYYRYLESPHGRQRMDRWYVRLFDVVDIHLKEIRMAYSENYSDRFFHDRQLCSYLARLLVAIGFDGDWRDVGNPVQWIDRPVHWPSHVVRMLGSRERGKCAICAADLVHELHGEPHIDHIVPLARGGCNDIVNLQILCQPCNLKKAASRVPTRSSMPRYIRSQSRPR